MNTDQTDRVLIKKVHCKRTKDPSDRLIESLEKHKFYKPSHCEQNDNFGFKKNSNVQNHSNGHNTSKVISKISVKNCPIIFPFF